MIIRFGELDWICCLFTNNNELSKAYETLLLHSSNLEAIEMLLFLLLMLVLFFTLVKFN